MPWAVNQRFDCAYKTLDTVYSLLLAFDTVCHKLLLSKLEHYGIRGPALNLISSYLNHRTQ